MLASGGNDTTVMLWDVFGSDANQADNPPSSDLQSLWDNLGDQNAARAFGAIRGLTRSPERAVSIFKERLKPAIQIDDPAIARCINNLDSRDFQVREKATQELQKVGARAEHLLREKLIEKPDLEVRRRIEKLLESLDGPMTDPDSLRSLRAIEVLEQISNSKAKEILQFLAKGNPEMRQTKEARESLQRLAKKSSTSP
jgi:HEAT repeat protein